MVETVEEVGRTVTRVLDDSGAPREIWDESANAMRAFTIKDHLKFLLLFIY